MIGGSEMESRSMMEHLEDQEVKEEVIGLSFLKLKSGMRLNIEGGAYKVIAVRPNGKITIKFLGVVK